MFKSIKNKVCVFDLEWTLDYELAQRTYNLQSPFGDDPESTEDLTLHDRLLQRAYLEAGATEEKPTPFIKPMLCKIISIACVTRDFSTSAPRPVSIWSVSDDAMPESQMIDKFLNRVGDVSPQLVGWNSSGSDLPILIQRAIANGVQAKSFFKRPDKPWEGRDYFAGDDWHIDMMYIMSPYERYTRPKLDQAAQACGFPGKLGVDGSDVAQMYIDGRIKEIREYNEQDALSTYLIWLRMAYCAGFFTKMEYDGEIGLLESLLESSDQPHRQIYLAAMRGQTLVEALN